MKLRSTSVTGDKKFNDDSSESKLKMEDSPHDSEPEWAKRLENKIDKLVSDQNQFQENLTKQFGDFKEAQLASQKTFTDNYKDTLELITAEAKQALSIAKTLQNTVQNLQKKLAEQHEANRLLKERVSDLECYSRKQNLIFDGLEETENENCEKKVLPLIKKDLGINVNENALIACHRLGQKTEGVVRPVMVRFLNTKTRNSVWEKKSKIRKGVSLKENFSEEVEERRRVLYPIYRKAKTMEKYKKKIKLVKDKLIIQSKPYTVSNLHTLPDDLNPQLLATPTQGINKCDCILWKIKPAKQLQYRLPHYH